MKTKIVFSNRAGRWFGKEYMTHSKSLLRRLAGTLPGVLLGLAVLPLTARGQANYATPYTFITLAGGFLAGGDANGTGWAARFYEPCGVAVDNAGNVYVADFGNNMIREVTPVGTNGIVMVTTLAGRAGVVGSADGTNSEARFNAPDGIAVDSATNLYVSDDGNDTIRKLTPVGTNWVATTIAGKAGVAGSTDGTNSNARFGDGLGGTAVDSNGNVYVADFSNDTIREVAPVGTNWVVTTIAGEAGSVGSTDGTNSGARFDEPNDVKVDKAGNLYVADSFNDTIRKVTPVGTNWVVTTIAGKARYVGSADGTNSDARFSYPWCLAVDGASNVYVGSAPAQTGASAETIRKLTPVGSNWVVTTLAGLAGDLGSVNGTGSAARFDDPNGIAVDSADNVYVGEYANDTIRKGFPPGCVPAPMLQPPSFIAGQFGFGIIGIPSLVVNLESSTDLINWQVIGTNILVGGTNSFVNPNPSLGAQFYRAQVH